MGHLGVDMKQRCHVGRCGSRHFAHACCRGVWLPPPADGRLLMILCSALGWWTLEPKCTMECELWGMGG